MANRAGYVYLLKSSTGLWKIGRTKNPDDRRRTFNVKLPFEVAYEHVAKTDDMVELERNLHNRFYECRVSGEWFALSDEDVSWIKRLSEDMGFSKLCCVSSDERRVRHQIAERQAALADPNFLWEIKWRGMIYDVPTRNLRKALRVLDAKYPIDCISECYE